MHLLFKTCAQRKQLGLVELVSKARAGGEPSEPTKRTLSAALGLQSLSRVPGIEDVCSIAQEDQESEEGLPGQQMKLREVDRAHILAVLMGPQGHFRYSWWYRSSHGTGFDNPEIASPV